MTKFKLEHVLRRPSSKTSRLTSSEKVVRGVLLSSILLLGSCGTTPVTVSTSQPTASQSRLKAQSVTTYSMQTLPSAMVTRVTQTPEVAAAIQMLGRSSNISAEMNFANARQTVVVTLDGDGTFTDTEVIVPFASTDRTVARIKFSDYVNQVENENGGVRTFRSNRFVGVSIERIDVLQDGVSYAQFFPEFNSINSLTVSNSSGGLIQQNLGYAGINSTNTELEVGIGISGSSSTGRALLFPSVTPGGLTALSMTRAEIRQIQEEADCYSKGKAVNSMVTFVCDGGDRVQVSCTQLFNNISTTQGKVVDARVNFIGSAVATIGGIFVIGSGFGAGVGVVVFMGGMAAAASSGKSMLDATSNRNTAQRIYANSGCK